MKSIKAVFSSIFFFAIASSAAQAATGAVASVPASVAASTTGKGPTTGTYGGMLVQVALPSQNQAPAPVIEKAPVPVRTASLIREEADEIAEGQRFARKLAQVALPPEMTTRIQISTQQDNPRAAYVCRVTTLVATTADVGVSVEQACYRAINRVRNALIDKNGLARSRSSSVIHTD